MVAFNDLLLMVNSKKYSSPILLWLSPKTKLKSLLTCWTTGC